MASQFRNLVFEGGGVKGIAYAGAIRVLEEKHILDDIERVTGTSAGAITACLLALGADAKTVQAIVGSTRFREFMDESFGVVRDTERFLSEYGWYKGDAFADWIRRQVYTLSPTNNPDLTFAQLEKIHQSQRRYRSLYVIGTDLTMQLPQVFSAELTPDTPIWRAVRISMSIPLFFACVRDQRRILVDGGMTWNYPLDLFDESRFLSDQAAGLPVGYPTKYGETQVYNRETLGLRVDSMDEIKAELEQNQRPPTPIHNIVDYVRAMAGFMMEMANDAHLHQNDWHRTIFIDARGVRTTDFDLSDKRVQDLVKSGEDGANAYFSWFEDQTKKPMNRI